ncbi:hypothetical protein BD779DRAFT_1438642 [Infundibulicybe gibba]|nr:hypothetical protein BD779DRAFT_1438642 [Infundibulicybe gibba]
MASYFGPQEPASEIALERYFLATAFISGIGYGTQGVLYFICSRYLWTQRKARPMNLFHLAYITLLFLISGLVQVTQVHLTQLVFIENRNFPGGPWAYYEASLGGTSSIVNQSASLALMFLSELFVLWRCWVVWYSVSRRAAYAATFFPTLLLIVSLISAIIFTFALAHPDSVVAGTHTAAWALTYYTLILGTNVITTAIILVRLIIHRQAMRKILAHTGEYTSLISMLIESAAFYSIIGATCVITSGLHSPVGEPLMAATVSAQQISGYLIIARLAHGRGWQKSTVSVSNLITTRRNAPKSNIQAGKKGGDIYSSAESIDQV